MHGDVVSLISIEGPVLKILHAVQSLKGGPAAYFDEIAPYQIDRFGRENVALIVPESDLDYVRPRTKEARIFTFPSRERNLGSLLSFYREFRRGVRAFEPDIVHLHSSFAGLVGRLALIVLPGRRKVVYCSHGWAFDIGGDDRPSVKKSVYALVERILARFTDQIVNISYADHASALRYGIGGTQSVVIHNGVADIPLRMDAKEALQAELGMDPDKINMLFVGRFDRQKGVDTAFEAARELDPNRYHLYAIGDAVVSGSETTRISELGQAENISLLGWIDRDKLPPYFAAADFVLMPSRWEGFGLVAIEAMRAQTPVLATKVGALPELIDDRVNGRLVEENSAEAFATSIRQELKDDWRRYGLAARQRFLAHFSSEKLNASLASLYARLFEEMEALK